MGSLTVALRAAQSGLLSTQSAVDATAKNIANANTIGYSRKLVNFENRVLAGQGSGVALSDFSRAIDDGLVEDLRRELSEMSKLEAQLPYYQRVQNLFGAPGDNTSISHIISQFEQAAESLALSPDKTLEQNELVRFGQDVALKLQDMTQEIQALRAQADQDIADVVDQINALTGEIADANDQIIRSEAISNDITDLLDKRDLALTKLSKLVDINTFPRSDGDLVVFSSDGFSLVDRTANAITHSPVGIVGTTSTYAEGDINGIFVGSAIAENDLTDRVTGGSLSGLIQQRDEVLPNLQSQLDELARELIASVNQIHNRGTAYPGLQSMSGSREFIDTSATAQVDTLTIGSTSSTFEAGDIYSVIVDGTTVSYTVTGAEGGLAGIRNALVTAINTNSTVGPIVTAKAGTAAGVLTLTADAARTPFLATATATNGGPTTDNPAPVV
ncbi:MAG: flagellar hook-associated protein FlgK, partial [Alphaproteobacteria bacterium]|nr:flagellar hook-associated protein FlgK [Alphaproteobacteria bacterium]